MVAEAGYSGDPRNLAMGSPIGGFGFSNTERTGKHRAWEFRDARKHMERSTLSAAAENGLAGGRERIIAVFCVDLQIGTVHQDLNAAVG